MLTEIVFPGVINQRGWSICEGTQSRRDLAAIRRWHTAHWQRQLLPFEQLRPFERVREQFVDWGVSFADAIALYPSNPRFQSPQPQPVLMPVASGRSLTLHLRQTLRSVVLQVRGYHDMRLTALNIAGQDTLCGKTFCYRYQEKLKAPQETIILDISQVQTLILKSSAPFVLESFSL